MRAGGRPPIGGRHSTEEPDPARVPLAGAAASTLGLRADANRHLALDFVVDGDGRNGTDVAPSVLFVEKQARRRPTPPRP